MPFVSRVHVGPLGMYCAAHNFSLDFAFCVQDLSEAQFWIIPSSLPVATWWVAKLCAAR